jgi:hypothetical protein
MPHKAAFIIMFTGYYNHKCWMAKKKEGCAIPLLRGVEGCVPL